MYPVTNEFKLAAKQPVQEHRLYGTIGSVSFDKSNIIQGSFHITNQCTDTNDVVFGSVYTGTLTATFTGLSIPRYAWIGKRITVYFGLKITPTTWEDIPMGTFTVKEAKHSAEGVSVTAYDDMIKLDKKFKKSKFKEPAKIYNFLTTICNTCGLILEDSEQTIQSRPNGNTLLGIVGTASNSKLKKYANDIETYRDLVFWIAQSMACFATINKLGHLTFVPYKNESNVVDEITEEHRIAGAVFDDFTTNYTGIYVTNTADGEEIYYGYDEQELEQEIATVEGDIQDVEIALDQLAQQYQQGQITEAEYKRQKKILDKQLKNLDKRLAWLNEALNKAQSEEDGLYMDLGENPMMQADGVGNTPTTMRKRILKALDAISYTPFTCDTVCGAHYDLGDIIRFTGGHATELGEVCCVMAYDFNMNGEYRMQGFGSDPSKGVMKSKNSKKADKANRNADSSAKNTTGPNAPTSGNEGDLYIKTGENLSVDSIYPGSGMYIDTQSGDANTGYTVTAHCRDDVSSESIHFAFTNLTVGQTYTMSCSIQIDEVYRNWNSHYFCVICSTLDYAHGAIPFTPGGEVTVLDDGAAVTLYYDMQEHSYQITFTASATTYYVVIDISYLQNTWQGYTCPTTVSNLKISEGDAPTEGGTPEGIKVYTNDQWKNLDYVKKVKQVQTSSGGTKIATAKNSDGTDTDIYAPTIPVEDVKVDGTSVVTSKVANINTMTGATASAAGEKGLVPAPAAGDNEKFLCGDGTFKTVSGGSSITPNPSGTATANLEKVTIDSTVYAIKDTNAVHSTDKGVANGVAELDANGKVPTAQIPSLSSTYLPLAGGEMTGCIDTYAPQSDIMPAIMPKTAFCGSVGFSDKPYRFGFFQGAVLGASYEEAGTSKMGTLTMYTGMGAYAAVIKPDTSQSVSEVDLVLPKTSGTLALTSEIPTKTSDLTNDSGYITSYTDEKVTAEDANPSSDTGYLSLCVPALSATTNQKPKAPSGYMLSIKNGTSSAVGHAIIRLGNSTASGSSNNKFGKIRLFSQKTKYVDLVTTANMTTADRTITLPDKDGTIALTADLTTYAFAEGTNNGEIKITPSVGGTAGTAVTVKPKGISDLAYIAKGSGSSRFLREDGTWQTVTASWSGGTITSSILPNATETLNLGSSTKKFASGYIKYLESYTGEFGSYVKAGSIEAGKANNESGYLTMWQANSSYNAHFVPPSTAYTSNVEVIMPSASGTLVCDATAYITTGLTPKNSTITAGGYAKIGHLVIFNIRLNVTTAIGYNSDIITGMPKPNATSTVVSIQNNRNLDISMNVDGKIQNASSQVPVGTLIVCGCYICQ